MTTTFELVSEAQEIRRRDYTVANRAILDPTNANPLLMGEFVNVDSAHKIIRAATQSFGFAVFSDRGRYDAQAIGKVTTLQGGSYEADTLIFTAASLTLGGALQLSATVSYDGQTKSGVANHAGGPVVGYVMRLPATNGNRLRFIQNLV